MPFGSCGERSPIGGSKRLNLDHTILFWESTQYTAEMSFGTPAQTRRACCCSLCGMLPLCPGFWPAKRLDPDNQLRLFPRAQTSSSTPARQTCSSKTRANRAQAVSTSNLSPFPWLEAPDSRRGGGGRAVLACLLANVEEVSTVSRSGAGNYLWRKSSTFRDTGNTASLSCTSLPSSSFGSPFCPSLCLFLSPKAMNIV